MNEPVNLNKFRKTKARADNATLAEMNTFKFGRSKAEKVTQKKQAKTEARHLDQQKREP